MVEAIASELIDLLRSKVNKVITRASDNAERFTVSVHRGIVNWEAVDSIGQKADLLVIATHGQTGLRHLVFGSVAEKVVRLAPCPVLTIRVPHKER